MVRKFPTYPALVAAPRVRGHHLGKGYGCETGDALDSISLVAHNGGPKVCFDLHNRYSIDAYLSCELLLAPI